MREIKARGISVDRKEWIYGYLIGDNVIVGNIVEFNDEYFNTSFWQKVHTETVGQDTGIKDKNGKEIFEGDIYNLGDKRILSVVEWHDSGFMGKQKGTVGSREGLQHWRNRIEIIGNIYENPELLEFALAPPSDSITLA